MGFKYNPTLFPKCFIVFLFLVMLGIFIMYIICCPFKIIYNVAYNRTNQHLVVCSLSVLLGNVF